MIPDSLRAQLPTFVLIDQENPGEPLLARPLRVTFFPITIGDDCASQPLVLTQTTAQLSTQAPPPDSYELSKNLDRYFTREDVAKHCVELVWQYFDQRMVQVMEPSAGDGAFLKFLPPGTIAVDPLPLTDGVLPADYLTVHIAINQTLIVVGNPPFGRNSALARDFFNHAAQHADAIAMILPKTFRKARILRGLDRWFHLLHDEDLPPKAFLFRGKPVTVPATFQIWERRTIERALPLTETTHPDFELTSRDKADLAIQRIGNAAGRVYYVFDRSDESTYFIRATDRSRVKELCGVMEQLDLAAVAANAAGQPSLAVSELVALYREHTEGVLPFWRITARQSARVTKSYGVTYKAGLRRIGRRSLFHRKGFGWHLYWRTMRVVRRRRLCGSS